MENVHKFPTGSKFTGWNGNSVNSLIKFQKENKNKLFKKEFKFLNRKKNK